MMPTERALRGGVAGAVAALLFGLGACRSNRSETQLPYVQPSSPTVASRGVTVTRLGNFSPPCLTIEVGETIEWFNPTANVVNVTSGRVRGAPPELYSPTLLGLSQRWRHRFARPGRFDYFNEGAGSGAVDPYYGTRTAGATQGAAATICVRDGNGAGCDNLCCAKASRCANGASCELPPDPEFEYGFCAPTVGPDARTD